VPPAPRSRTPGRSACAGPPPADASGAPQWDAGLQRSGASPTANSCSLQLERASRAPLYACRAELLVQAAVHPRLHRVAGVAHGGQVVQAVVPAVHERPPVVDLEVGVLPHTTHRWPSRASTHWRCVQGIPSMKNVASGQPRCLANVRAGPTTQPVRVLESRCCGSGQDTRGPAASAGPWRPRR